MDPHRFAYGGFTLSAVRSHALWLRSGPARAAPKHHISAALPRQIRFGLFPFRSPLLGKSRLISLPRGTKMLQFPRFDLRRKGGVRNCAGFPLGHLGINGCVHLPRAYRSLPRPSSLLKPSNPPIAVFAPALSATYYTTIRDDHRQAPLRGGQATPFIRHFHGALHPMLRAKTRGAAPAAKRRPVGPRQCIRPPYAVLLRR